ncbi:MAG: 16S rRNA (guanine(527)-N(7))-methyltransferase RsmG [Actinobacteria bacterium]|jgi:16S rRNA (guanine527-N7)-methyltransferase|nr:16S rRNA (guanine(527)-N(7))-methyltransferase RsmG [Actinomycetota bacterium]
MNEVEAEPTFAGRVFGDRIDVVRAFTENLAARGEELGLIGPLELARLWTRHVANCGLVAPLLARGARVGDVGSGAGLPGLVLAIARPDVHLTLIEPMDRRVQWLETQVAALELSNVDVVRARAEDCAGMSLDQVTARAVSALRTLIPITAPAVRPGGELILMKGAGAGAELAAAAKQVSKFKLRDVEVIELGGGDLGEPTWVVRAKVDGSPR